MYNSVVITTSVYVPKSFQIVKYVEEYIGKTNRVFVEIDEDTIYYYLYTYHPIPHRILQSLIMDGPKCIQTPFGKVYIKENTRIPKTYPAVWV